MAIVDLQFFKEVVLTISMGAWILAAIRQYPFRFRWYFIGLAASDPINKLLQYIYSNYQIPYVSDYVYLTILVIVYISVDRADKIKSSRIFNLLILAISVAIQIFSGNLVITLTVVHVVIFFRVFLLATMFMVETRKINLFFYLISFYELTLIINFLRLINVAEFAEFIYYSVFTFQVILAGLFAVFTEASKRMQINMNIPEEPTPNI